MPILAFTPPPLDPNQIALDVILGLPAALTEARGTMTLTTQAKLIGVTKDTLTRVLKPASQPTYPTIVACLRYLADN